MKILRIVITVVLASILVVLEFVDLSASQARFGVTGRVGVHPGGSTHEFRSDYPTETIKTTPAYGLGVGVSGIGFLIETELGMFIEFSRIELEANMVTRSDGATATYDGTAIPIMLWMELSQSGRLGAFVIGGIGATHVEFAHLFDPNPWYNSIYDYWSFAWGYGGGLRFTPIPNLDFAVSLQNVVGTGTGKSENEYGWVNETNSPFSVNSWGLSVRYWF
jgi:opacity protein-like surface antigen